MALAFAAPFVSASRLSGVLCVAKKEQICFFVDRLVFFFPDPLFLFVMAGVVLGGVTWIGVLWVWVLGIASWGVHVGHLHQALRGPVRRAEFGPWRLGV